MPIPHTQLSSAALQAVVEEFVTRDQQKDETAESHFQNQRTAIDITWIQLDRRLSFQ